MESASLAEQFGHTACSDGNLILCYFSVCAFSYTFQLCGKTWSIISWIFEIYDLSHLFQTEPTDPKSIVDQNPKVYPDTPIFDGLVMITISMGAIILKHVIHLNNIKPPCQIYWVGTDWGFNPVDGSSNFRQTQKEIWKRIRRKKSNKICHNMRERKGQPYDIFRKREIFIFSLVFTVCSEM